MNTTKLTNENWLNLFSRDFKRKDDSVGNWTFASRSKEPKDSVKYKKPDAVFIAAVVNKPGQPLKHVVTVEYRVPLGGYEFGLPAGLIDKGETPQDAAKREFLEETGMTFVPHKTSPVRLASSAGSTDECIQIVFGTALGDVSTANQEASEDIQVHLLTASQLITMVNQDEPLGCVAWNDKAWPILTAFANQGLMGHLYGVKS